MRQFVAVLVAVFAASAFGQAFPTRPITLIVPYAAGGSADVVARPVAAEMGKLLLRGIPSWDSRSTPRNQTPGCTASVCNMQLGG